MEGIWTNECPPATENCGQVVTQRVYEIIGNILEWNSVSGRQYAVYSATDLSTQNFQPLDAATNLPATPEVNRHTNLWAVGENRVIYQLRVWYP